MVYRSAWQGSHWVAGRLSRFRVLEGLADPILDEIASEVRCFCLPAGEELQRTGPDARALFFVMSGALSVMVPDRTDDLNSIAIIRPGETVGEMSLLTCDPPSARLFALRDVELVALDQPAFERLITRHPVLLRNLSVILVDRLRKTTARTAHSSMARCIALIAGTLSADPIPVAHDLAQALRSMGISALVVDESATDHAGDWFHAVEASHDIVIYVAHNPLSAWARKCERRADRLVEVTCAGAGMDWPSFAPPATRPTGLNAAKRRDVVVLCDHASARLCPSPALPEGSVRHLLRRGSVADLERFARFMCGRALGLVLSGGGARGFAHLGVLRALRENGVMIDAVGGTSMGALIAACVAMEWSDQEIEDRLRAAFVASNPLSDIALPLVAFFRGRKVDQLLTQNFGDRRIEHLALPFLCMTSDLTSGRAVAHTSGPLARTLRASIALPGVLPAVTLNGHVHVDGGVMNNIPVDEMGRLTRGGVIAVDVSGNTALLPPSNGAPSPGILSVLVRTGTVGNEWQRREAHRQAVCLFEPPVADVGFRDWMAFDRAVERGRLHAEQLLSRDHTLLGRLGVTWSDALSVDEGYAVA
jgi:NTE family protein